MGAFRESIRVFVDAEMSPQARSARLAGIARAGVAHAISTGAASPIYQTFVDGQEGADESAVRAEILYRFAYLGDAVEFALLFLQSRSPVASGAFRDSFMVAVDGRPIPARQFVKRSIPPAAEVYIYDLQPYSRKVDVQLSGGRRLAYSTPSGMFDDAVSAVRRRFGNTVKASRLYTVRFPGQWRIKRGQDAGRIVDSPALVLKSLE